MFHLLGRTGWRCFARVGLDGSVNSSVPLTAVSIQDRLCMGCSRVWDCQIALSVKRSKRHDCSKDGNGIRC